MTFETFWAAIVQRNPRLANEQETFTLHVRNYRDALQQAFAEGEKEERAVTRLAEQLFGKGQSGY